MAKNIIVPTQIFTEKEHVQFRLPIFLYLQMKQGRDCTLLTSLDLLLNACGYVYNRQSKNCGYIAQVKDALHYLKDQGYIDEFYDRRGIDVIEEINDERPTTIFTIKVNDLVMNYDGDGFAQIFVDDYCRIVDFSMKNSKHRISKMLYMYCFISRYVYRKHKNYSDDVRHEDKNILMARETPNYYFATYDRLSAMLGDGFSKSSIIKLLDALSEAGAIHYRSVGSTIINDEGDVRSGGTVFVMDSKYWEVELEAAVQMEKNKKSQFYKKGDKATA